VIQRGDKVLYVALDMPGTVVDVCRGEVQVTWDEGYPSPFSGETYWGAEALIERGLVEVIGENGKKPAVPETLINPIGRDLFQEADQLLIFELAS
jgi:hypothetical protein